MFTSPLVCINHPCIPNTCAAPLLTPQSFAFDGKFQEKVVRGEFRKINTGNFVSLVGNIALVHHIYTCTRVVIYGPAIFLTCFLETNTTTFSSLNCCLTLWIANNKNCMIVVSELQMLTTRYNFDLKICFTISFQNEIFLFAFVCVCVGGGYKCSHA